MLHYFHLKENLLHVQCVDPISLDLIYFILGANSVFVRSMYQLDFYTLLVDLNVPPDELDFDLATDIIGAAQKYFWTYQEDTSTLSMGKANDLIMNPRIIQDYSFYLVEGYMLQGSPLLPYYLLFNFNIYGTYGKLIFYSFTILRKQQIMLMVSYLYVMYNC